MDDRFWESISGGADSRFAAEASRALIEHTRDIIFLMRRDGTIVLANAAAEIAYGWTRAELRTKNIAELRAPDSHASMSEQMAAASQGGILFETTHMRRDLTVFPVEVSSRGVEVADEPYLLSVIRDISARRRREREREELLRDLEVANHQLEGLLRIVSTAVGRTDLDALLPETLAILCDAMNADGAMLFVLDHDQWVLHSHAGYKELDQTFSLPVGEGFVSMVAQSADALWSPDVTRTTGYAPVHDTLGIKAMLGVPLRLRGELFGVLEVAWAADRLVSEAERVMLRVAADRVMSAIGAAQRYEATRRTGEIEAALAEASARLAVSRDLTQTVPAALQVMASALDCDGACYCSLDAGSLRVEYGFGVAVTTCAVPDHHGDSLADVVPVVCIDGDSRHGDWLVSEFGLAEALVVPVRVHGDWAGVVLLGRSESRDAFSEPEQESARRLAALITQALANARDFDAEHRIAETLQEALLTLDAPVGGVVYGHAYRSSTLQVRVGGDFYDVFGMAGGLVGVLVGDVSGKGLDAAVLTTLVKHTIRAFAHDSVSPASIMAKANATLAGSSKMRDFASALFVVIDPVTGHSTYCRAGHPPGLIVRGDGRIDSTLCGSPVIGAFADMDFDECSFSLASGDLLVLYTDGVTEARDASGEFFGEERLLESVRAFAGSDPETATAGLDQEVRRFTGGNLSDDVAIVVVARS